MSRIDADTAQAIATDLVKRAGFVLNHAATTSESCYYYHPAVGKKRLLRVSTHRGGRRSGLVGVVSKVTCGRRDMHLTEKSVETKVVFAIGVYFLTEPKPSEYRGERGTWEPDAPLAGFPR